MWGEYYLDPKTKKVMKSKFHEKAKPIFVQYVLDVIWKVYDTL